MLFLVYKANHPELTYKGGQEPIVHLEADLHARWSIGLRRTALDGRSLCRMREHAISRTAAISHNLARSTGSRCRSINGPGQVLPCHLLWESKQAEFLLEAFFPWELVERDRCKVAGNRATRHKCSTACSVQAADRDQAGLVLLMRSHS